MPALRLNIRIVSLSPFLSSKLVKEEVDAAEQYFNFKERCIFCDVINQELEDGRRVIYENKDYLALAPFCAEGAV